MTRPRVKQWERLSAWERLPAEPQPEPKTEPPICFACGSEYVDRVNGACDQCVRDHIACGGCRVAYSVNADSELCAECHIAAAMSRHESDR